MLGFNQLINISTRKNTIQRHDNNTESATFDDFLFKGFHGRGNGRNACKIHR